MSVKCAYHPDRGAVSSCVECSTPVCRECETLVKGKPVCQRCVANIKSKVEAELGTPATPIAPGAPVAPAAGASPYGGAYASPAETTYSGSAGSQGTVYTPPSPIIEEAPSPARFLMGIVAGAAVALIGSIIWEKIYFHANFMLAWAYILIGGGVGVAVVAVSGRHGILSALLSSLLYAGGMLVGHWMLVKDLVNKELPGLPVTSEFFMEAMKLLGGLHWVFVAVGLVVAFVSAMKEPGSE
jgi:hypothetical protein